MAMRAVTVRAVQALNLGETIWDSGHREAVKGFGARRQRGTPVYVIKYRLLGEQRFVTIGSHGAPWTPENARKEAKRLLGLVAGGRDPQAEKKEARAKAADTLGKVAEEYLGRSKSRLKPRTYTEVERHLQSNWERLHPISIFHLTRRQVAAQLSDIETTRGAVTAGRARAALSAMFNWAIREGFEIASNPVAGTNRPNEPTSRNRVLTDAELARVWAACRGDDYGRIVRLLILTAQRREEVGGLGWNEINADAKLWTIPGTRTKNHREHVVPLSDAALALLPPPRQNRAFIFGQGQQGFSGWSKSKAALDERAALFDWRLHDVRRTAATVMADRLGVLPHVIEAVLNHVSGHRAGVAGIYNRATYSKDMREALERWADHIEAITN
jgi:integrase